MNRLSELKEFNKVRKALSKKFAKLAAQRDKILAELRKVNEQERDLVINFGKKKDETN